MTRARVLIAGLGDAGLLTAIHLARHRDLVEVTAVGPKASWLHGHDLGWRLARPELWQREHRMAYGRFKALDGVRIVHGVAENVKDHQLTVRGPDGTLSDEPFDVLVIATGVRNGFWRTDTLQDDAAIDEDLGSQHASVAAARTMAVVGAGPVAVSVAAQVAGVFPDKRVDLYFPGDRGLSRHHPAVWTHVRGRLETLGVVLHPQHRAVQIPQESLTPGPVRFAEGQAEADLVLWATGQGDPHTAWLPESYLDPDGFVKVDTHLRVPGADGVWAVGDVAATDPLRGSARNNGAQLLAANIVASLRGRPLRTYTPFSNRWGTLLGPTAQGITIYTATGRAIRIPHAVTGILREVADHRFLYRGIRPE